MIIALCILLYFLSVLVFAYLGSRAVGDTWPAAFAIIWPIALPFLVILGLVLWAADKGEDHAA